jgi:uncharacterized damage-inducible protein DinB
MPLADAFISNIAFTRARTLKLVADLNDDQIVQQPAPKTNHPAWVLGHMLVVDAGFYKTISGTPAPDYVDETFNAIYGNKSEPTSEKARYKPKQWYLDRMADLHNKIIARLKAMTPEEWDGPHPDETKRTRFPTLGHQIAFYGIWHETYHGGQLSTWRRVLGLPPV